LFGLLCSPEDGGDILLQIVGWLSADCMALYSKKTSMLK
jgi:hypothetical protein